MSIVDELGTEVEHLFPLGREKGIRSVPWVLAYKSAFESHFFLTAFLGNVGGAGYDTSGAGSRLFLLGHVRQASLGICWYRSYRTKVHVNELPIFIS